MNHIGIFIYTATNLHFRVYENPLFEELLNQKLISMLSKIDDAKSAISFQFLQINLLLQLDQDSQN